jgi:hypothetical protein
VAAVAAPNCVPRLIIQQEQPTLDTMHHNQPNDLSPSLGTHDGMHAGLVDDPYRSLAALVRKAGGFNKSTRPFSEVRLNGDMLDAPSGLCED